MSTSQKTEPPVGPTSSELRKGILMEASLCVTKDRQATHGDAEDNFRNIAELWRTYCGFPFTTTDVAAMMVLVKISRLKTSPYNNDNWVDIAGYAACGGGIAARIRLDNDKQPPL